MMARRAGERGERMFGVMGEVSVGRGGCRWSGLRLRPAGRARAGGAGQAGGAGGGMLRGGGGSRHSEAAGQAEAMATFTRRALMRTRAPIFRSLRRIVPHVAAASAVWESPIRRKAHRST